MSHISITQGAPTWGEHVTDAEYGEATKTLPEEWGQAVV